MDAVFLGLVAVLWLTILGFAHGCRYLQNMGGRR